MKSLRIAVMLAIIAGPSAFAQSEWTQCSRDRACTSWAQMDPTFAPPFTRRVLQLGAPIAGQFKGYADFLTSAGGILFVGFAQRQGPNLVQAFDPATGVSPWTREVLQSGGAIGMAPVIAGSIVIAGGQGQSAHLHGFNRHTGAPVWDRLIGNLFARQVTVDFDWAYVFRDTLWAISTLTGSTYWSKPLPNARPGRIVIDDTRIFYAHRDTLYAAAKNNGAPIWASPGASFEGLCLDAERVYVSTKTGVRAARRSDGVTAWSHTIDDGRTVGYIDGNGMALDSGRLVYVVWYDKDSLGTITALDKRTGVRKWTHVFPGAGATAPTLVNNTVYVVNWSTHHLYGLDLETGAVRFRDTTRIYYTMPIIANGRMYVGVMNPDSIGYAVAEFTPQTTVLEPAPSSAAFTLGAYPNPFSHATSATVTLSVAAHVRIDVVDLLGRTCSIVKDGWMDAGLHTIPVVFTPLPGAEAAGVYQLRCVVRTGGAVQLRVQPLMRL